MATKKKTASAAKREIRIAVDIGGTFTDGVAELNPGGRIWVGKCLTTPQDPGEAVSTVVADLLRQVDAALGASTVGLVVLTPFLLRLAAGHLLGKATAGLLRALMAVPSAVRALALSLWSWIQAICTAAAVLTLW